MKGFTLIELLVVIGIVVILMAATLVAINPFRQFAMANNAARWSGVTTIMNAVSQNMVDYKGRFRYDVCETEDIPTTAQPIRADDGDPGTNEYDICECIIGAPTATPPHPSYVATVPYDPQWGRWDPTTGCTDYDTGRIEGGVDHAYTIVRNADTGRITICAPTAQLGETICITR